ncbi:hypothetical protein Sulku_2769 (plasmid) [Sulfuricurvum kujiense DSM 16994]|uniref:HNH endonuclease n=1 Tax=Sulfuricurvum kujiense (strain ATCC BAA-921 / DSM 16994 / JCM 11577 / YK-1) TaxID=709032 RepID=E4U402_SULKY|nr:hypothetical protein [Sulfuricurvum kujiense]ADR35418.1 hypothetical protein Sulku_2769 [Sulfuricurvum kujiense DSM 16994]
MKRRDNFTQKTIEILKTRVAHRCSNPNCRIVTAGPTTDIGKVNIIGEAAHLYAAAPGGPRYDSTMSPDKRKSIENAIWLCSNCSDLIDKDPDAYPIELLNEWKQRAEQLALEELGKKLPDKFDAINTLTTAMTGTCNKSIPDMLRNVSVASANYLHQLDPRLRIDVAYQNKTTIYTFFQHGEEPVDLNVKFSIDEKHESHNNFEEMFNYGKPIELAVKNFELSGSPIFDTLLSDFNAGTISVRPESINANMKIWLSKDHKMPFFMDDVRGEIFRGTKALYFTGTSCNGLFQFEVHVGKEGGISSFSFGIDFSQWIGSDILRLPYFTKIYDFMECINDSWSINGIMEINGEKLFEATQESTVSNMALREIFIPLRYIAMVRKFADYLKINLTFQEIRLSKDLYDLLDRFEMAVTQTIMKPPFLSNPSTVMHIESEENLENLRKSFLDEEPTSVTIEQQTEVVELFNQKVPMPVMRHVFTSVFPKLERKIDDLTIGDHVKVEFIPAEECEYYIELIE